MAELTLHVEASADTDLGAASAQLQEQLAGLTGIVSAQSAPQRFQGISAAEIMSVIKVGTDLAQSTAGLLGALAGVYAAWQKLRAQFPGLRPPTVEVGLEKVPVNQVTPAQAAQIAADA